MSIDLISMLAAGVLTACIVFAANHLSGKRLPRWLMPAAVGVVMLGFSIWNEYSWFSRVKAQLPETVTIVRTIESSQAYRPWTYLAPITLRFMAVDSAVTIRSTTVPGLVAAEVMLVQRYVPTTRVPVAFDCNKGLRADLLEGAELTPDGTLSGAVWLPVGLNDDVLKAACLGG
ncbi:hypothetical protein [Phaeovulum sp.]|uniref:hypothetical protein n=1 Tax=Phaeovulum sp. TaxID=2934796 RepID=UPI0039E38976